VGESADEDVHADQRGADNERLAHDSRGARESPRACVRSGRGGADRVRYLERCV
jgi:hypothetical protein